MAIKLRSRKPYTCRREQLPGKPCAAYLTEEDGDVCSACVALRPGELKPITVRPALLETVAIRRIWPAADPLEPGEIPWEGRR